MNIVKLSFTFIFKLIICGILEYCLTAATFPQKDLSIMLNSLTPLYFNFYCLDIPVMYIGHCAPK